MARILSGGGKSPSKSVGRPGFGQLLNPSSSPRGKIGNARRSVRRLFARDPADGITANIGTPLDITPNAIADYAGNQNPTVLGRSEATPIEGDFTKKVRNRSTNRRIVKR